MQQTVHLLIAAAALVVLLVVAFRHLPGWAEALVGVAAAGLCLGTGVLTPDRAGLALRELGPVVAFLIAILVVSGSCADQGLFRALGQRMARPGQSALGFLRATYVVAVAVTVVLSLDATVVLLTPVVLAAARRARHDPAPSVLACVRLANTSSLLLPISNLTTLLALHALRLSFAHFAWVMAPVTLVVVLVEYAGSRLLFPPSGPAPGLQPPREPEASDPLPRFALTVLVLMLVALVATSPLGVAPAWVVAVAAVVLVVGEAILQRAAGDVLRRAARSANLGFAVFVLGLGVVVAGLTEAGLGPFVRDALPHGDGLGQLLLLAAVGGVLSNVVNNLPATLLLVPAVAPLGTTAVLATIIGVNVGSSLTWTGSLANLLWRRTLARDGVSPTNRTFHRVSVVVVPVAVVLGVLTLWLWAPVAGA